MRSATLTEITEYFYICAAIVRKTMRASAARVTTSVLGARKLNQSYGPAAVGRSTRFGSHSRGGGKLTALRAAINVCSRWRLNHGNLAAAPEFTRNVSVWPNPSVNRTRSGRPARAGRRYKVHFRRPALAVPPPRAGYLER